MQSLQQNITTLFDPEIECQEGLFDFTERLVGGLPGCHGNTLLVLKLGIPTPSAELVYPKELRKRITADLHLGAGRDFIRHVRPRGDDDTGSGGPVYRLNIPELPMPQKHLVHERAGI
ncbi:hypothetical protein BRC21_00445 [Candidatus Saccharibacteria bacterium SW_7_54_9]|nr:MAG: hypothetical protein BRC21_00445 [Candidatus Saccharibacteria bacterium SW_7_54_9]